MPLPWSELETSAQVISGLVGLIALAFPFVNRFKQVEHIHLGYPNAFSLFAILLSLPTFVLVHQYRHMLHLLWSWYLWFGAAVFLFLITFFLGIRYTTRPAPRVVVLLAILGYGLTAGLLTTSLTQLSAMEFVYQTLHGAVMSSGDRPAPGVPVLLSRENRLESKSRTNAEGFFQFLLGAEEKPYAFRVQTTGHLPSPNLGKRLVWEKDASYFRIPDITLREVPRPLIEILELTPFAALPIRIDGILEILDNENQKILCTREDRVLLNPDRVDIVDLERESLVDDNCEWAETGRLLENETVRVTLTAHREGFVHYNGPIHVELSPMETHKTRKIVLRGQKWARDNTHARGNALENLRNFEGAREYYMRALSYTPNDRVVFKSKIALERKIAEEANTHEAWETLASSCREALEAEVPGKRSPFLACWLDSLLNLAREPGEPKGDFRKFASKLEQDESLRKQWNDLYYKFLLNSDAPLQVSREDTVGAVMRLSRAVGREQYPPPA